MKQCENAIYCMTPSDDILERQYYGDNKKDQQLQRDGEWER
jgi:hypothetical protein